jgi:hypothetical protein
VAVQSGAFKAIMASAIASNTLAAFLPKSSGQLRLGHVNLLFTGVPVRGNQEPREEERNIRAWLRTKN